MVFAIIYAAILAALTTVVVIQQVQIVGLKERVACMHESFRFHLRDKHK